MENSNHKNHQDQRGLEEPAGAGEAAQKEPHAALVAMEHLNEQIWMIKGEALHQEMEGLQIEQQRLFGDTSRPLQERMRDLDSLKKRMDEIQDEMLAHEKVIVHQLSASSSALTELNGREVVLQLHGEIQTLRDELEQQRQQMTNIPRATAPAFFPWTRTGWTAWPFLVLILLLVTVGIIGFIFPLPSRVPATDTARVLVEVASAYQAAEKTDDAIRVLDDLINEGTNDPQLLDRIGKLYYSLKEYQKAAEILTQVVAVTPNQQTSRLSLARSLSKLTRYQDAIAQYDTLVQMDPNNVIFYIEAGNCYESLLKFGDAEAQYLKATQIVPDRYEGYYNLGQLYRLKLFDYVKAEEQYQKALEKKTDNYLTNVYLGASLAGQGKHKDAIDFYDRAIILNSQGSSAPFYAAESYLAMGQYEKAISWYQQTLELNPKFIQALIGLGNAYAARGDCEKGSQAFSEALKLQPSNVDAKAGFDKCTVQ